MVAFPFRRVRHLRLPCLRIELYDGTLCGFDDEEKEKDADVEVDDDEEEEEKDDGGGDDDDDTDHVFIRFSCRRFILSSSCSSSLLFSSAFLDHSQIEYIAVIRFFACLSAFWRLMTSSSSFSYLFSPSDYFVLSPCFL